MVYPDRRPPPRAAAYDLLRFALLSLPLAAPVPALAQGWDEEVIQDPEQNDSGGWSGGGDEEIYDPEQDPGPPPAQDDADMVFTDPDGEGDDHGWGDVYRPPASHRRVEPAEEEEEEDPLANTGVATLELGAQFGYDIFKEGDLEDVYETRLRLGGEIEFRRSRRLRLVLGSRLDLLWAVPAEDDPQLGERRALAEDRFELDILATAAYVDATLADGLHLRVGQQTVTMGRLDFASQTDVLAIYDLRPNPKLDASGGRLAQPAVRLDWDMSSRVTLQLAYVPWFSPHLMRPNRDRFIANALAGQGAAALPDRAGGVLDPSFQTKASEASLRFVGPAPDFSTPQLAGRLNLRTTKLELALVAGAAIEKIPSIYMTPELEQYLRTNPHPASPDEQSQRAAKESADLERHLGGLLQDNLPLFDTEYHRYLLIGLDSAWAIGPVSFGLELAYSPERHPWAVTTDGSRLAAPNTVVPVDGYEGTDDLSSNVRDRSIRKGVPTVHAGLHLDYMKGESLLLAAETFWVNALELPHDQSRQWMFMTEGTAFFAGVIVAGSYLVKQGRVRFDLLGSVANGPSFAISPRVQIRASDTVYLDLGALFIGGSEPAFRRDAAGYVDPRAAATNVQAGGLLKGSDQVFVGLRWLP